MTIRHLKTFIAVCEYGGITRAAEKLHVAQPSVSQTVAETESYYGVKLFVRAKRRLILTEQGKKLLPKAREAVESFENFEKLAYSAKFDPTVRIGASLTLGKTYIPLLLTRIKERYPEIAPRIYIDKTSAIESKVLDGELDFAIVEGAVSAEAEAKPFACDRLLAVCGANFSAPSSADLKLLAELPLLLREKGSASRDLLDSALAARGLAATPVMQSASNQAIIAAAIQNCGAAVLPEKLVLPYVNEGKLRTIEITDADFRRTSVIICGKNKIFTAAQRKIYGLCLETAK